MYCRFEFEATLDGKMTTPLDVWWIALASNLKSFGNVI
jgi:hypothetical protein